VAIGIHDILAQKDREIRQLKARIIELEEKIAEKPKKEKKAAVTEEKPTPIDPAVVPPTSPAGRKRKAIIPVDEIVE